MTLLRIVLSEFTGTFVLVFFILQVSNPNTTFIENELSGFGGIVIFIYIAREYAVKSGNEINAALLLAVNFLSGTKGDWSGFTWIWLWIIGDILGAIFATKVYDNYFEKTIKNIRCKRREEDSSYYSDRMSDRRMS